MQSKLGFCSMKRRKLTWQGRDDGAGRWRKVYQGQIHYFGGGNGKSDLEAYRRAVTEWEQLKVTIDQQAEQDKPHRREYEQAIGEWHTVLSWGRENDDVATTALFQLGLDEHFRVLRRSAKAIAPKVTAASNG